MYVDPNRNRNAGNLRWLMAYCKPDLPRAIGAIVLYAVSAAMALITPLISARIVDQVIEAGHISQLTGLCILMIVVTVVRDAAYYGNAMWMERFGQNTVFRLVSDEYEKLHELDFNYFNHTRTGDIMSRMTSDTDAIRHLLSWVTYQALNCVVMFVGALAMMSSIDWRLALALACVTPPLFLLTRALSQRAKPLFLGIRNSLAAMNSMVEENIEGNRVVKAFVREEHETGKFDERNADYMDRNMAMAENTRRFMPWLDGLGFSLQLITIGLGGLLVLQGNMTLGGLVAFSSYLWMIDSPVRQSGWLVNDWQRFNASCVKIRRLLTSQPRIREESPERAAEPRHVRGAIHFDHVSFAFPDDPGTPVLDDIDFAVPAGARLGILGETGAGKSTLVNMIARFYDPTSGRVLIDGVDARAWPLKTLREEVSVVAQDTFLFSDTIGGNIGFGLGGRQMPDPEYIRRIAFIAGADDFIERMPEGYDTVVGERGVGLSGGQKQRLSLARDRRRPVDSDHGRHDERGGHGDRGEDPAASGRIGGHEDDCDDRAPHLVGQGLRPDPHARARAHRGARHARGTGRRARPLLADLPQTARPAIGSVAGLHTGQRDGRRRNGQDELREVHHGTTQYLPRR